MKDTFLTWSTQYMKDDELYYVRLDEMTCGDCKTVWQLDYGRFKTYEEAQNYIRTLPEPEEAFKEEMKV